MEVLVIPVLTLVATSVLFSSPQVTVLLRNQGALVSVYATDLKGDSRQVSVTNDGGRRWAKPR